MRDLFRDTKDESPFYMTRLYDYMGQAGIMEPGSKLTGKELKPDAQRDKDLAKQRARNKQKKNETKPLTRKKK